LRFLPAIWNTVKSANRPSNHSGGLQRVPTMVGPASGLVVLLTPIAAEQDWLSERAATRASDPLKIRKPQKAHVFQKPALSSGCHANFIKGRHAADRRHDGYAMVDLQGD
jgi:hypothetical protein